ncbi:hypothetical protein, partial [Rhodoblastus sp.]|uniref:hypothetical protein n=1 Tax=Rhodoblastus sp. TaxID=1962975 RepID=UPI003F9A34B4
ADREHALEDAARGGLERLRSLIGATTIVRAKRLEQILDLHALPKVGIDVSRELGRSASRPKARGRP